MEPPGFGYGISIFNFDTWFSRLWDLLPRDGLRSPGQSIIKFL